MALRELKFVGPTLLPSIGLAAVTVRLGSKWATLQKGAYVRIRCCGDFHEGDCDQYCESWGVAVVLEVWNGQFGALPARLIAAEHEPVCRDWDGLHETLSIVYAPAPVDEHSQVVAISFKRVSDYVGEEEEDRSEDSLDDIVL